jgi:hypothetical protein
MWNIKISLRFSDTSPGKPIPSCLILGKIRRYFFISLTKWCMIPAEEIQSRVATFLTCKTFPCSETIPNCIQAWVMSTLKITCFSIKYYTYKRIFVKRKSQEESMMRTTSYIKLKTPSLPLSFTTQSVTNFTVL